MSRKPARLTVARAVSLALPLFTAGCAPALDWREMQPGAAGLRASFPCRPAKQVRSVPLGGAPVTLTLHVCTAEGLTFAINHADVVDPARVGSALGVLRDAMQSNLGSEPGAARAGWQVPGMTPQPASGRWSLQGHAPDGQPLRAETAVFSRGTVVVQATLLGGRIDEAAARGFFEGLRFAP